MRDVRIGSGWLLLGLGLLAFAGGPRADAIEHSGPILADTVWRSADEHLIVGDVTVYPQVTLTIEAGTTVHIAVHSDTLAGGDEPQLSELIVDGALIVDGTAVSPVTFTSYVAPAVPGEVVMSFDSQANGTLFPIGSTYSENGVLATSYSSSAVFGDPLYTSPFKVSRRRPPGFGEQLGG